MKKLAILMLVIISLFSMAACGSNKDVNEEISIEPTEASKDINKGISIEPNDTTEAGPCNDYEDIAAWEEANYRQQYVLRLSEKPEALAEFLYVTSELDEFVWVDAEDRSETIKYAVEVFSKDKQTHQRALERAKEIFDSMQIDCNWEEVRKNAPVGVEEEYKAYIEQDTPTPPLAINAETGKPISNEPAGPLAEPTD